MSEGEDFTLDLDELLGQAAVEDEQDAIAKWGVAAQRELDELETYVGRYIHDLGSNPEARECQAGLLAAVMMLGQYARQHPEDEEVCESIGVYIAIIAGRFYKAAQIGMPHLEDPDESH